MQIITNHKQIKYSYNATKHPYSLFLSPYYSKFFLILIGKPPPYQKQNFQHINLKSWSLELRLLWVFKNKESLEKGQDNLKRIFLIHFNKA